MKILLTNDDGVFSEGLQKLAAALSRRHEVYVSAPDRQRSASSHCVTYFIQDLIAKEVDVPGAKKAYAVSGTPADCVYAGLFGLYDEKFDLVISGINDGPNYSTDTIYSGTIGAAGEAVILGIPSIAVSLSKPMYGYETSIHVTEVLLDRYMTIENREQYVLSVNVPALPLEEIKGIKSCVLDGKREYGRKLTKTMLEDNSIRLHSNNESIPLTTDSQGLEGDVTALEAGYVTVTALDNDMLNRQNNKNLQILEQIEL